MTMPRTVGKITVDRDAEGIPDCFSLWFDENRAGAEIAGRIAQESNADHLVACWNAIEDIGGGPPTAENLLTAVKLAHAFLDSLPEGWLRHTSGDVGALNDFYLSPGAVFAKASIL